MHETVTFDLRQHHAQLLLEEVAPHLGSREPRGSDLAARRAIDLALDSIGTFEEREDGETWLVWMARSAEPNRAALAAVALLPLQAECEKRLDLNRARYGNVVDVDTDAARRLLRWWALDQPLRTEVAALVQDALLDTLAESDPLYRLQGVLDGAEEEFGEVAYHTPECAFILDQGDCDCALNGGAAAPSRETEATWQGLEYHVSDEDGEDVFTLCGTRLAFNSKRYRRILGLLSSQPGAWVSYDALRSAIGTRYGGPELSSTITYMKQSIKKQVPKHIYARFDEAIDNQRMKKTLAGAYRLNPEVLPIRARP